MATTSPAPSPAADGTARAVPYRGTTVVVALGVALLSAAIVLSTGYSRADGELDWSVFGVGLLATGALLAMAGLGVLGFADTALNRALATWPVAFGALGAGLVAAVAMDANDASPWIAGLLVTVIGAAGYAVTRNPAPALATVVGLVVLYTKALDQILDGGGDNYLRTGGLIIVGFVLLVTAAAWFLPGRDVVAVTVGAFGVFALVGLLLAATFIGLVAGFTSGLEPQPVGSEGELSMMEIDPLEGIRDDLYALLVLGAVLVLVWLALAAISGHTGYRVLVVALVATQLPITVGVLGVDHPSYVAAAAAVAGAVVLVLALVRARSADAGSPPKAQHDAPAPPTYDAPTA